MFNFIDYLSGKKKFMNIQLNENSELLVKVIKGQVYIEGDSEGFLYLAKLLIDYAYDNENIYPENLHLYPSTKYTKDELIKGSDELIFKKVKK